MAELRFEDFLHLDRCPHCARANPSLQRQHFYSTNRVPHGWPHRVWGIYECLSCGGVVTAWAPQGTDRVIHPVMDWFPKSPSADIALPEKVLSYLQQALETIHAPAASIMVAASAVDEMLKQLSYTDGSLYGRIDLAKNDHLITEDMALWAHDVRLDANDQRHADANAQLPTEEDARRVVDFVTALGDILFVLPSRVQHGREAAHDQPALE